VIHVLSCEILIFSQIASGFPLQFLQLIRQAFGYIMFCFFIPDSNNIHAPGVVVEFTLYTLPRGRPCICEFCLGDEAKRGAVLGLQQMTCMCAFTSSLRSEKMENLVGRC
jgi:hypothetical protein